ncbi:MAG: YihY/virulence factor BrkB family protein [Lachnospiraceae bacterium]|nr:YihY/virulence factor BrkB family protein [Lachnospiraceae bacterium]MCI9151615.1 YihY/virulence factor BrkB family protein [Lachnospiraceae bacterium]
MAWKVLGAVRLFIKKCSQDNISAFAAQSAFFVILSIIPFLMVFISMAQYTPVTESMVMELVYRVMPSYISPFLVSIIHEVYTRSVGIISITAVMAVWASAKGVQYLSNGLNVVYDRMETRNWFRLRFRAILYTLVMLIAIILSLTLLVFGNSIQKLLQSYIPFVARLTQLVLGFRVLIILGVLILFFMILYKMLPNRKATLKSQLPGSVLCAIAWYGFSFGVSIYVDYFNGFSMYGSLTTIALVMLWLYFCMYILLVCAEINNIYEQHWKDKMEKKGLQI